MSRDAEKIANIQLATTAVCTCTVKANQKTPTHTFLITLANILIILSLLHSKMNCRRSWNHLALNMLPQYLAKVEYSHVQLFIDITQNN